MCNQKTNLRKLSDLIQILPEHIANQIAAGEVVQRPASALKELLENAVDAGSSEITVVTKEGGKTLLQVTDNGCGMSFTDARMAFERHATSKIRKAEDLFQILTMGFRGEALASIASVAQVELKTRKQEDELGTQIIIEGSNVLKHEHYACSAGTTFIIKNLFYNIPARRNFLKSTNIEFTHIVDEFTRVALANYSVEMNLYHNDLQIFKLPKGNLKQRIVHIFGNSYKEKLLYVSEKTDYVTIEGYVGKPDTAKKKRGEQFFFVNNRFIKHAFFHHAISSACEGVIEENAYPAYFLNISINPKHVDVNIHPTKTEIKFDDEKTIYHFLKASTRQVIGQFHLSPTLDFDVETSFSAPNFDPNRPIVEPKIHINPDYNPFNNDNRPKYEQAPLQSKSFGSSMNSVQPSNVFDQRSFLTKTETPIQSKIEINEEERSERLDFIQISDKYIITTVKSGLMFIDSAAALLRIHYEQLVKSVENNKPVCQQLMFPETIKYDEKDFLIIKELWDDIKSIGFDIEDFGHNTIIINGIPIECQSSDLTQTFDDFIEQHRTTYSSLKTANRDIVLKTTAARIANQKNKRMTKMEINHLIDTLFECNEPYITPSGKPIIIMMKTEEINNKFEVK